MRRAGLAGLVGLAAGTAALVAGLAGLAAGRPEPAARDEAASLDAFREAARGSVCGDGDYADPHDPASLPGFGAPKRVAPPAR